MGEGDEKSKKKMKAGLNRLLNHRPDKDGPLYELFPYNPLAGIREKQDPEDDRARGILAAASLEQALEHALSTKFVRSPEEIRTQLFGESAPLRDFAAKARMAYAFGIVGEMTFSDIGIIRQIRNTFAHSRTKLSSDTSEMAYAASCISLGKRYNEMNDGNISGLLDEGPRDLFFASCFEYSLWLFREKAKATKDSWMMRLLRA